MAAGQGCRLLYYRPYSGVQNLCARLLLKLLNEDWCVGEGNTELVYVSPSCLQTAGASGERQETHGHVRGGAEIHQQSGGPDLPFRGNPGQYLYVTLL